MTLKILWDRLIGITFEVGRTLEKAAFSIVVREGKDYGVVITDAAGNCVAQPWDCTPVFLGTLPDTIRHFLKGYPPKSLRPGDSLITNDPWQGTGHLSDVSIATPIFDRQGRLIAFAGCTAHMTDIGGTIDRVGTREVFEEGLLIPVLKLEREGVLNEDVIAFIRHNVRVPDGAVGDIMAMLAAGRVASRRLTELVEQAHIDNFGALADEIVGRTEEVMRAAIRKIPPGTYRASSSGDGFTGPFTVAAAVHVSDGEILVDFEGTSPQSASCLNSVIAYTFAFTAYSLKCLVHPKIPNNEGAFRPIRVVAPEGSCLNARRPVAVHMRNLVGHFITPTIFRALAEVVPDRVMAESGSTPSRFETWSGVDPDGRHFVQLVGHNGGMGASPHHDGEVSCFPSNMATTPVEIVETQAPLLIREKRLIRDSAGTGRYRGGLGQRVTTRNLASFAIRHEVTPCRLHYPPQGILGGGDAGVYRLYFNGAPHPRPQGTSTLQPGDEVTVEYPGGAGFGAPSERDRHFVIDDVLDGAVSPDKARQVYGVEVEAAE